MAEVVATVSRESPVEQSMRLAAARLGVHANRTRRQATALEAPMGFGEAFDRTCREQAAQLRRDAGEDQCRIDELRELLRRAKAAGVSL